MSYWNYRVIENLSRRTIKGELVEEAFFNIHSVHYDDDGEIRLWSVEPYSPQGETLGELMDDIARMSAACDKPVLEADRLPGNTKAPVSPPVPKSVIHDHTESVGNGSVRVIRCTDNTFLIEIAGDSGVIKQVALSASGFLALILSYHEVCRKEHSMAWRLRRRISLARNRAGWRIRKAWKEKEDGPAW